jgi:tetratricopeptide (TPR) repeat protein
MVSAERLLPSLLELSGPDVSRALFRHPELQPDLSQLLLGVVNDTVERSPVRAHELTSAVIEYVAADVPLDRNPWMAPYLRGNAWTAHAAALRGIGRYRDALEAIAAAHDRYQMASGNAWHIAAAEMVEAEILCELEQGEEALQLIVPAAAVLLGHGDVERYVRVRMREALILCEAGNRSAAAEVWRGTGRVAQERGDFVLMGLLECAMGTFELRHGRADEAARHFERAYDIFDGAGLRREAIQARRGVAEAAVARGRFNEAISEYYKVQGLWIAAGNVAEAALAALENIELLRIAGRDGKVIGLADFLANMFADAGRDGEAQAWTFIRESASTGELTLGSIEGVRRFLSKLPLQPNAKFESIGRYKSS